MSKLIFNFTDSGIKPQTVDEETFFIIDAKEFLQTLFSSLIDEKITSIGKNISEIIKNAITLLKEEYEICPDSTHDLINSFLTMNPEIIHKQQSLMEAYKQSIAIAKLTKSNFLTPEEARIIQLAFFNDENLKCTIDDIDDIKKIKNLEKQSLIFKKNVKIYLKNIDNNEKEITKELNGYFSKNELPIFDALLDDLVKSFALKSATQTAFKHCQNIIPFKSKKKSKLLNILKPNPAQKTSSFGDKN